MGYSVGLRGPVDPGGRLIVSHMPRSKEENHCSLKENLAEMFVSGFTHFLLSGMS